MEVCVRRVRCAAHQCGSGCEGWASGMKVREVVRLVRDVKRVRMEVSVAGAGGDTEVRLVVLAILKCERTWTLARVGPRVHKRAVQSPKKLAKSRTLTEGAQEGVQERVAMLVAVRRALRSSGACESRSGCGCIGNGNARDQEWVWNHYATKHDIKFVSCLNMRHSFAKSCLHAGIDVTKVSKLLGHTSITTTVKRSVRFKPDDLVQDFRRL